MGKLAFEDGLLAENGSIIVDNAFRHGGNYLPSDQPPDASRLFGTHVTNDKRLHKVLVPLRDGILVIRRASEVEGRRDVTTTHSRASRLTAHRAYDIINYHRNS